MKLLDQILVSDEISIVQMKEEDIDLYYKSGFENPDDEVTYYTGTSKKASKGMVYEYFKNIIPMEDRYDFFIMLNNIPIGEIVISNIVKDDNKCSMRLTLFKRDNFNKGYGSSAIRLVQAFAFDVLQIHRIELEVFSYNERGMNAFKKTGFKVEGRLREAKKMQSNYTDIVIMGILKAEYENRKSI